MVDHNSVNPELGGEDAFRRLSAALATADIGLILDFVSNHMGVHYADNPWWLDVLEWGPKSPCAASFDIDWQTLPAHPGGGVLIPVLGTSYGEALERGEIELRYDAAESSFSASASRPWRPSISPSARCARQPLSSARLASR